MPHDDAVLGPARARVIRTPDDIREGVAHLRRACPLMRAVHDRVGDPPLRRYRADLAGLARVVVGQQVSIASASAIWRRLEATVVPFTATTLLTVDERSLAGAGLSAGKIRTLKAIASALRSRALSLGPRGLADETRLREQLLAICGVGPWTVDIFVMFGLGRADAWAPGDLALQIGTARIFGDSERFSAAELEARSRRWQPWRGVAARLIWADYGLARRTTAAPQDPRPPP